MIRGSIFSLCLTLSLGLVSGMADAANSASDPIGIYSGTSINKGPQYSVTNRGGIKMLGMGPPPTIGFVMRNSGSPQNFSPSTETTTVPLRANAEKQTVKPKSHSVYIKDVMHKKSSSTSSKFSNQTFSIAP